MTGVFANINFTEIFLHLDITLQSAVANYHTYVYFILFAVIFCQIGLVVMPFLPADSVLFAAGSMAAMQNSELDIWWVYLTLVSAAILGNSSNYWIGRFIGAEILYKEKIGFINRRYVEQAHIFYERYGGIAIIIARFIHIIRTFIPFTGGISRMHYGRFVIFSVIGSVLWVSVFTIGGFFFGRVPAVKENFVLVIIAIVAMAIMPAVISFIRQKKNPNKNGSKNTVA
jgi:membrane-associated protein